MSQLDVKSTVNEDIKPYPMSDFEEDEEELDISPHLGSGYVWAMKIPRFLLERWERVTNAGVELGTLVVDNSSACDNKMHLKIDPDLGSVFYHPRSPFASLT